MWHEVMIISGMQASRQVLKKNSLRYTEYQIQVFDFVLRKFLVGGYFKLIISHDMNQFINQSINSIRLLECLKGRAQSRTNPEHDEVS